MSSSLPNRSILIEDEQNTETLRSYIIAANDIKNPPRMAATTDDGSGTASNPRNIVNNRRRSESFAVYSNQEFFPSSSPNDSKNSFSFNEEVYFNEYPEDSPFYSPDGQLYPHNLNVDKKIVLYKTEMCRTFEETGNCKYGTKCQFAHDPIEIRNIPRHPRYKTEICKTFWQLGNCPYGKRCCFIHTENELRDSKQLATSNSQDIYGSADLTLNEDSVVGEIQSHNSSRSASPSKAAENLKKSISNIGPNSIFNNLSISDLPKLTSITERRRRKSIIDDRIEELAMLVGSNCSISNNQTAESDKAAPSSDDPEFKACHPNAFELWSRDSPAPVENQIDQDSLNNATKKNGMFAVFDKSPGSRNSDLFSTGIWSKGNGGGSSFLPGTQFYNSDSKSVVNTLQQTTTSTVSSGTSSSKSSGSNHQQLLIDMLNLLDSAS